LVDATDKIILLPPNLAELGVMRAVPEPDPDLIIIWETPNPVLTNYKKFCREAGLEAFAGGNYKRQGLKDKTGYITSGYRDGSEGIGTKHSEHNSALCVDVNIGDVRRQIQLAEIAMKYFHRIGFYPRERIMHLGLGNDAWMDWVRRRYKTVCKRFWVKVWSNGQSFYRGFDVIEDAIKYLEDNYE